MAKKKDFIFIGIVLVIAILSLVLMNVLKGGGSKVVITYDGELYGTYDLNNDDVIYIEAEGGTNTVKIQDGSVSMIEASCPDQICVHSYALSKDQPGMIVCLPHKIVVEIQE